MFFSLFFQSAVLIIDFMTQCRTISSVFMGFVFVSACASVPAKIALQQAGPTPTVTPRPPFIQAKTSPPAPISTAPVSTASILSPSPSAQTIASPTPQAPSPPETVLKSVVSALSKNEAKAFEKITVEGTRLDQVTRIQFLQFELDILEQSATALTFHFPKLDFSINGVLTFFKDNEKIHTQNFAYTNSFSSGGGGGGGSSPTSPASTPTPTPTATSVPDTFVFEGLSNNQIIGGLQPLQLLLNPALNPTQIEFFKNGESLGITTTAPFRIDWNTLTEASGAYQIHAEVTDAQGQIITAPALTLEVNQPPEIQWFLASPNPPSGSGFPVLLNCHATDSETSLLPQAYSWSISPPIAGLTSTNGSSNYWVIPESAQGDFGLTCTVSDGSHPPVASTITINVPAQTSTLQATGGIY